MKILITGFAGFIGFHASQEFLRRGWEVVGIDNFCDYYDVKLKRDRAALLEGQGNNLSSFTMNASSAMCARGSSLRESL